MAISVQAQTTCLRNGWYKCDSFHVKDGVVNTIVGGKVAKSEVIETKLSDTSSVFIQKQGDEILAIWYYAPTKAIYFYPNHTIKL